MLGVGVKVHDCTSSTSIIPSFSPPPASFLLAPNTAPSLAINLTSHAKRVSDCAPWQKKPRKQGEENTTLDLDLGLRFGFRVEGLGFRV